MVCKLYLNNAANKQKQRGLMLAIKALPPVQAGLWAHEDSSEEHRKGGFQEKKLPEVSGSTFRL